MKVGEKLKKKKRTVDQHLDRILPQRESLIDRAMRYAVFSGGKRFRSLLALSSGEYFGVSQEILLPFACALELIHNYSLIHDDLPSMDNDDFRRGKPSCHKAFGEDIALLAGDGLLTLAFEVMVRASLDKKPSARKERLMAEISHLSGKEGMIGGQALDITFSAQEVTEEDYHRLVLKKTGSLFIASLKVGAILGDADPNQIQALEEYGEKLGLAFQIRDDIIDSFVGDAEDHSLRPNAVSLFGLNEAKHKLEAYVRLANRSLKDAGLESEELCYLASKLLEIGRKNEDGQNS